MNWLSNMLNRIYKAVQDLQAGINTLLELPAKVDLLLEYLTPPPATSMKLTIIDQQGAEKMAKTKLGEFKLNLLDNGTAAGTLSVQDAAGLPTTLPAGVVPTYASSDPGVVVTPAADGLSCTIAPATPPVLVTGAIITASAAMPDGTTLSADNSSDPLNVVAGPAGSLVLKIS